MALTEQIYDSLVISPSKKFDGILRPFLSGENFGSVHTVSDRNAAKRICAEHTFDLIFINAPLSDGMGTRLAIDLCRETPSAVLLLIPSEAYAEVCSKVQPYGVFTLPKPVSRAMLTQALDWLISARARLKNTEKRTLSIEEKMEEIRLVNRAKWILIRSRCMEEAQAHRYIEKQAMDRCVPRRVIAEEIIRSGDL